nr:MAG TPA: hypothetical protein [Caudoviricetes sp.]
MYFIYFFKKVKSFFDFFYFFRTIILLFDASVSAVK